MGSGPVPAALPGVSFSASSLTFGDELQGTISQPLLVTLTNSGYAALTIASIAATANFTETDGCGSTLLPGANCVITVTFAPYTGGSLHGFVTVLDNGAGSPQMVSLSGTGTAGATTIDTLTGYCLGASPANMCSASQEPTQCPVGQAAIIPQSASGCVPAQSTLVDTFTHCQFNDNNGNTFSGSCAAQATAESGTCSVLGQECGSAGLAPCCSEFECSTASDPGLCQPAAVGDHSRAHSSLGQRLADRIP